MTSKMRQFGLLDVEDWIRVAKDEIFRGERLLP